MLYTNTESDGFKLKKSTDTQPSFDLRVKSPITIKPYENRLIATGVRVKVPRECVGLIFGKNSTNRESILVFPTIYDTSFSGIVSIQCMNLSDEPIYLKKGHTLAQLIVFPLSQENNIFKEISIKDFMSLFQPNQF